MKPPISALGRPLDPSYATNRWIALLAVAALVVGSVAAAGSGAGLASALRAGLVDALVLFLAWALARELDPDAELAAFLPVALAAGWLIVWPAPSLVLGFALLLVLRVVNRTVGPAATTLDSLVVLALVAWAAWSTGAWTVAAMAAVAFGADRRLEPPGEVRQLGFAGAAAVLAVAVALTAGTGGPPRVAGPPFWTALAATVLFAARVLGLGAVTAQGDRTAAPLYRARVRTGMALGLALGVAALATGRPGLVEAGILWSCLAGLGAAGVFRLTRP